MTSQRALFPWQVETLVVLAIVMALVVSACRVEESAELCSVPTEADVAAAIAARPTPDPSAEVSGDFVGRQALVVVAPIPQGLTVQELIENPTAYLSARLIPPEVLCTTSIQSVAQLQQMLGYEFGVTVDAGFLLDTRMLERLAR